MAGAAAQGLSTGAGQTRRGGTTEGQELSLFKETAVPLAKEFQHDELPVCREAEGPVPAAGCAGGTTRDKSDDRPGGPGELPLQESAELESGV